MTDELYELGLEKRRKVLGAEFVDRTIEGADDFTRGFQHFLTEYCWEESGPRERPSATVSTASTPSASWPPSAESRSSSCHFRGALRNGCTLDELRETLLQVTVYAGAPAGVAAFRAARKVLAEDRPPDPATGSDPQRAGLTPMLRAWHRGSALAQSRRRACRCVRAAVRASGHAETTETGLPRRHASRLRSRCRALRRRGRRRPTIERALCLLERAVSRFELGCHAWCYLPNHSHLLVTSQAREPLAARCTGLVPALRSPSTSGTSDPDTSTRDGSDRGWSKTSLPARARALRAAQPGARRIVRPARRLALVELRGDGRSPGRAIVPRMREPLLGLLGSSEEYVAWVAQG